VTYGSSVPDAIAGLFTLLRARGGLAHVSVLDHYPKDPAEIVGDTGLHDVVFLGREGDSAVTGSAAIQVMKAAPQVFDETYTLWLTCQSLKDDSDGSELAARKRSYELMAEVIGTVATDARLGLTDSSARSMFHVGLGGDAYQIADGGGWLSSGGHGWRVSVGLNCTARITLS
jgi:hypothetical protein